MKSARSFARSPRSTWRALYRSRRESRYYAGLWPPEYQQSVYMRTQDGSQSPSGKEARVRLMARGEGRSHAGRSNMGITMKSPLVDFSKATGFFSILFSPPERGRE